MQRYIFNCCFVMCLRLSTFRPFYPTFLPSPNPFLPYTLSLQTPSRPHSLPPPSIFLTNLFNFGCVWARKIKYLKSSTPVHYLNCNFPMNLYVRPFFVWSVGWSVRFSVKVGKLHASYTLYQRPCYYFP